MYHNPSVVSRSSLPQPPPYKVSTAFQHLIIMVTIQRNPWTCYTLLVQAHLCRYSFSEITTVVKLSYEVIGIWSKLWMLKFVSLLYFYNFLYFNNPHWTMNFLMKMLQAIILWYYHCLKLNLMQFYIFLDFYSVSKGSTLWDDIKQLYG